MFVIFAYGDLRRSFLFLFLPLRELLLRSHQPVSFGFCLFFGLFVLLRRLSSVCSGKTERVCSAAATCDAFSRFNWSTPSPSQQTASPLIVDLLKFKGDGVNGLFPIKTVCVCVCKRVQALRSLPKVSLCVFPPLSSSLFHPQPIHLPGATTQIATVCTRTRTRAVSLVAPR